MVIVQTVTLVNVWETNRVFNKLFGQMKTPKCQANKFQGQKIKVLYPIHNYFMLTYPSQATQKYENMYEQILKSQLDLCKFSYSQLKLDVKICMKHTNKTRSQTKNLNVIVERSNTTSRRESRLRVLLVCSIVISLTYS